MTQPSSIAKEFSSSHGDRLIRVLVGNPKSEGFNPTTFPETEIERVMGTGEDRSALVLRSGTEIPVALPYEELEQKIYERDFRTDGPVLDLRNVTGEAAKPKAPANTNQAPSTMPASVVDPGDKMPDGTVFAGISPDTNKPMYARAADDSLTMTFNEAKEYTARLAEHGHKDWRLPTKAELNVLFNNRAAIGGFDISGSFPAGWYWSASPNDKWSAWGQRFSDGLQLDLYKGIHSSVRPVR